MYCPLWQKKLENQNSNEHEKYEKTEITDASAAGAAAACSYDIASVSESNYFLALNKIFLPGATSRDN